MKFSWRKGSLLGRGAFCSVYLGLNLDTGELMAVKELSINQKKSTVDNVIREVKLLSKLNHQHIVKYLGTEMTEKKLLHIFMEYVPGGSLEVLISTFGCFPERLSRMYTKQIVCGLCYLHEHGILHRDIKGGNVLISHDGVVKLADFGASRDINELAEGEWKGTVTGTPLWMAPEIVLEKAYGKKADVYSVGATVMEMMTGKPPNSHISNFPALVRHWDKASSVRMPEDLSEIALDFLAICLHVEQNDRASSEELLVHPFVADAGDPGAGAVSVERGSSPPYSDRSGGGGGNSSSVAAEAGEEAADDGVGGGYAWAHVVVADNTGALEETCATLRDLGCGSVEGSRSCEGVLRILQTATEPVVVLVDEEFPSMHGQAFVHSISGLGLALHIRFEAKLPTAATLFFVAHGDHFVLPSSLAPILDVRDVLQRPLSREVLQATLDALAAP